MKKNYPSDIFKLNKYFLLLLILFGCVNFYFTIASSNMISKIAAEASLGNLKFLEVLKTAGVILTFFIFQIVFKLMLNSRFFKKSALKMQNKIIQKYFSLPFSFFYEHNAGDIVSSIYQFSASSISNTIAFFENVSQSLLTAIILAFLFYKNFWLTLLFLVFSIPSIIVHLVYLKKIQNIKRNVNQLFPKTFRELKDVLTGALDISTNNIYPFFQNKFKTDFDDLTMNGLYAVSKTQRLQQLVFVNSQRIIPLLAILVYIYFNNATDSSFFIGFYFLTLMIPNLYNLFLLKQIYRNVKITQEPLQELFETPDEKTGNTKFEIFKYKLTDFSVTLRKKTLINKFNLNIHGGEKVLIIGGSGTGKSVLLNALMGVDYPCTGSLTIGGVDMAAVDLQAMRKQIGYCDVKGYVITGSILENLQFNNSLSETEIKDQLEKMGILKYMPRLADLNSVISSDEVSDGEREVISILRCVFAQPQVLFLDEATSGMTAEIEKIILTFAQQKVKAIIAISHNYTTTKYFNRLIYLKGNTIGLDMPMQQALNTDEVKEFYSHQIGNTEDAK
ncbi:ATP-binding cassette domain-containing protein [Treponema sp. OMZ 799]|uniref:ATP-binding cassette domain-containing protein n=1 Tax=Treponema sp. OMZ 799 TaxID=2563668 RepID=UPI0020A5C6C5|nr:ATP-binding cassette domain-containing protein [Treponema sp. OMZ 799]UTC76589.1 ATP-binding cassette domain-containing protein [Treponema sp. OMZ 799]